MSRVEHIGRATLYLGDCRDVLPTLGKVDAVVTDPPYYKVIGDYWDNEWDEPSHFLDWMRSVVALLNARLALNGSLYLFASPQMAARVEVVVREAMQVLAMITWNKGARRKGAAGSGVDVTSLRTFWQASSERIIFAEPYGSDSYAGAESTYDAASLQLQKEVFAPLGMYFAAARRASGLNYRELGQALGRDAALYLRWEEGRSLPNEIDYAKCQALLPDLARSRDDLKDEYAKLRSEFDTARAALAPLRKAFESLRRPFNLNDKLQWGDVWDFDPPPPTSGKHPCEKPLALLQHIIQVSTKPKQVVLDAFMGSGATGDAALRMGRSFIGIERDEHWFAKACKRVEEAQRQGDFFVEAAA